MAQVNPQLLQLLRQEKQNLEAVNSSLLEKLETHYSELVRLRR